MTLTADWDTDQVTVQIPDLTIRVKVRRGFLKSEWVDVKSYMLNRKHCIIKTDELFSLNSKINISLRLKLEPTDLVIDSLSATVLKQKKECSCFFYYLELNDENTKNANSAESPIGRLVSLIDKKQLINKKFLDLSQASS